MKLKKRYRTNFDLRVRVFFGLSFFLFLFTFLVLQPFNAKNKGLNFALKEDIAVLENENNTLRR